MSLLKCCLSYISPNTMILKTLSEMIVPFILYGMIYNFTLSMLYVVHNNVEIIYNDVFMYINMNT